MKNQLGGQEAGESWLKVISIQPHYKMFLYAHLHHLA